MDTFDLATEAGVDNLDDLFTRSKQHHYMVFTIDSDVCFYSDEQESLVTYLKTADVPHRRITVHSDKGHDSFLLEPRLCAPHLTNPWHHRHSDASSTGPRWLSGASAKAFDLRPSGYEPEKTPPADRAKPVKRLS